MLATVFLNWCFDDVIDLISEPHSNSFSFYSHFCIRIHPSHMILPSSLMHFLHLSIYEPWNKSWSLVRSSCRKVEPTHFFPPWTANNIFEEQEVEVEIALNMPAPHRYTSKGKNIRLIPDANRMVFHPLAATETCLKNTELCALKLMWKITPYPDDRLRN